MTLLHTKKGFTIIELIIAIAVLSFGIMGIYTAFLAVVSLNATVASRFTASYLAQEGFEIVQNMSDTYAFANCALGCQLDYKTGTQKEAQENRLTAFNPNEFLRINTDGFYSYDQGEKTKYQRKITIIKQSEDIVKVVVNVNWSDNSRAASYQIDGYLYHIK